MGVLCNCKVCDDECLFPSSYEIHTLLNNIDQYAVIQGQRFYEYLCGLCLAPDLSILNKLQTYKGIVLNIKQSLFFEDECCYCPSTFFKIKAKVDKITGIIKTEYSRQEVDTSDRNEWLLKHPGCVRFEKWEKALLDICPVFDIKIEKIEKLTCQAIFTVKKKDEQCLNLLANVVKKDDDICDLSFKVVKKDLNCDWLNIKVFKAINSCKLDWNVVRELSDCGVKFAVSEKSNDCVTIFHIGQEINICNNNKEDIIKIIGIVKSEHDLPNKFN